MSLRRAIPALRAALEPTLDLLDTGVRLYRRNFPRLLLLATLAALPLGAAAALGFATSWLAPGLVFLLLLPVSLLMLPLSLYVMGALSRAAAMAARGAPLSLRQALAIGPLRVLGMGCYGTLFTLVAGAAVSMLSSSCFCVFYLFGIAGFAAAASVSSLAGAASEVAVGVLAIMGVITLLVIYVAGLILNGAVYGSVIYALQPFVHEPLPFRAAVRRSLDMTGYRFGQNLLAFLCASLVFGAAALATTVALGVLIPLPVLFLLGTESPLAQGITVAALVAGVSAAVPLLPIWMALLYQQRLAAWRGDDLAAQIAVLAPVGSEAG